jgi:membrane associated rhomboid family serine protease
VLIPIGLDEAKVSRLPWASIAILALNVLVFAGQCSSGAPEELESRAEAVARYWGAHPDLEAPPELAGTPFDRAWRDEVAQLVGADAGIATAGDPARLAALGARLAESWEAQPERRFGLVPARGLAQPGWLTSLFLHGDLFHLLGNMLLFFLVVGPFLEDAWGRPFFLALYLGGGLAAGAAQAALDPSSAVPVIGASGAISACLGAFALRFAHRRVRIFYWFFVFLRGTFFVPAWAYAFLGFAVDLWSVRAGGGGGGVAYAAHVGGFLAGLATASAVRFWDLDARLSPDGAGRWGVTLASSRGQDALASGDLGEARLRFEAAVSARPDDEASLLELARLEAGRFERGRATELVDRLLALKLRAGDLAGARAVLAELGPALEPARLRPQSALRAAELVAGADPALADRLDEVAAGGEGALAAKALLRLGRRARGADPERARGFLGRAAELAAAPEELRARARELLRDLSPPPATGRALPAEGGSAPAPGAAARAGAIELPADPTAPGLLGPGPVRVLPCRITGATPSALSVVDGHGRAGTVALGRVEAIAAGLVEQPAAADARRPATLLVDLLLAAAPAAPAARTVLRVPGHALGLQAIHPGVEPGEAWARLLGALVERGATPLPSLAAAAGRPFDRHSDAAAFEIAAWGRPLGPPPGT